MLTVAIDLRGLQVVVIGGGRVAARKVLTLLESGATVRLISPELHSELEALTARTGPDVLMIERRCYQPGDTAGAAMVLAATGVKAVDAAVATEARDQGRLVAVAGEPIRGNLHFTAEVRRGRVRVGVSTSGASPLLAQRIRSEIAAVIGPEYGELADLLAPLRVELGAGGADQAERAARLARLDLAKALVLLRHGKREAAQAVLQLVGHS